MTILHEVCVQLNEQCTALRIRIADAQRGATSLKAEYDHACRALAADEGNEELGRAAVALREKVEIAEAKLRGVQLLLVDKERFAADASAALASAALAQNAETQQRELEEKSQQLHEACREALKQRNELADQVLAAKATMEQKQQAFFVADYVFREELEEYEALATNFAVSEEEIAERHREVTNLKAERLTAMRERDEAIAQCGAFQRAWQQACAEYEHACNVARWNLPPVEAKRRAIPAVA